MVGVCPSYIYDARFLKVNRHVVNITFINIYSDTLGQYTKVPQQNNFRDCRVYVLQYVESLFQDTVKDYYQTDFWKMTECYGLAPPLSQDGTVLQYLQDRPNLSHN
jgi:hypothetical protein